MGVKFWLIQKLGGFTLDDIQRLETEVSNLKEIRVSERGDYEKIIARLESELETIPIPVVPTVAKPIALTPLPWSRLRRQYEKESLARSRKPNEKTN